MTEDTKLTKLGKKIVPVELVGQNADYRVLIQPAKPAYPKGNEVRYSDDYTSRLNATYSINEVLGTHVEEIAKRKGIERFVMDSPLRNSEGEDVLAYILINSAQAESWQPFIIDVPKLTDTSIKTAREYLESVDRISPTHNKGMMEGGILFGLSVAKRGRFVLPMEHAGKVIVVPSQAFVEYISQLK